MEITDYPHISGVDIHYVKPKDIRASRGQSNHYWLRLGPAVIHTETFEELYAIANTILDSVKKLSSFLR